ncbi:hypothetical protein [Solitalea koreensis]|uniref:Natural product n=1 Tax=Solitalea koreensis TaxID=543615 RepID=A0A521DDJ8_9SPHI|nr:hypothetical protein [Solitalea koreensis]SMO69716.1 hypothetical protein SAMN06265350_106213 [Solitalea koreensis]
MKKLTLKKLNLESSEVLTRKQLKMVLGGSGSVGYCTPGETLFHCTTLWDNGQGGTTSTSGSVCATSNGVAEEMVYQEYSADYLC